jgi:hypothetical protein
MNPVAAEALTHKLVDLKGSLRSADSLPLEALLIERIALTWLQLAYLDVMGAQRAASLSPFALEQLE